MADAKETDTKEKLDGVSCSPSTCFWEHPMLTIVNSPGQVGGHGMSPHM
jgi:hypothetical protein